MSLPAAFDRFKKIWCYDFEFHCPPGENPQPICMVACDLRSGEWLRLPLFAGAPCPFDTGEDSLFVTYYAVAEVSCHLSAGWPVPSEILDLFAEFRCLNNGQNAYGNSLLDALTCFGIDSIDSAEKEAMRHLAMRGGPYSREEMASLVEYCESDVVALVRLLPAMASKINLQHALLRGKFMAATATMERNGIPIDTDRLGLLRDNWPTIKTRLVGRIDSSFGVYDGVTFRQTKFQKLLSLRKIPWPRLASGRLNLSDETFKTMAASYPDLEPLRELRSTLGKMRLTSLTVGADSRNRCMLSPFRSKTSRNQPSNSKFIFGPSVWMRSLIKPDEGFGLAYIDWSQQEFGIAAALSQDAAMMEAYTSGDPYLAFGIQAGAIPPDGTKLSHKSEREVFKQCALAVQYGMGAQSLGLRVGKGLSYGRELLALHRRTYPQFWKWNEAAVTSARVKRQLASVYGWRLNVPRTTNDRTLANFPMQANGAEMLRLAIIFALSKGVKVCAPIHDAILIEAPIETLKEAISLAQQSMRDASRFVLDGFELRSDIEVITYPDRYMDPRGERLWLELNQVLLGLLKNPGDPEMLVVDDQVQVQ